MLKELKVACIWCKTLWNADMKMSLDSVSGGCDTCGYGSSATITVNIYCPSCNKLVYTKTGTTSR